MNSTSAHYTGQDVLHYKNTNSDLFERIAQPVPPLPIPQSSQSLLHSESSPWHIPSETGSVLDVSTAGSNPRLAYTSVAHDYSRRGDHYYGWEFPELARGYEARVLDHPFGYPFASSQIITGPRGTLDQLFPRIRAYEFVYTDDASMKLGNGVRRRCFNCRATETTTWRRSTISHGKLLCNKCGLYERTHSVARPKTFPRRRRLRPASESLFPDMPVYPPRPAPVFPDMYPPHCNVAEHRHHDDSPSPMALPAQFPNTLDFIAEDTTPQHTSFMAHNMPSVPSTPSNFSPCLTATQQPTPYCADFQLPTTYLQDRHAPSHLSDLTVSV